MSSSLDNMSIADIEQLLLLRKEQDRKVEEEKKWQEREDQEKKDKQQRDKECMDAEAGLARAAKELEDEMEVESDRTGDADVTPKVQCNLFGDLEGDEEGEEVMDLELDETSKDAWEKEWFLSHKEVKSAELHLTMACDNLTTALYSQKTYPGVEMDAQLVEWRKELQAAMACVISAWATDVMLTVSVIVLLVH
jgi:hypothetical protein